MMMKTIAGVRREEARAGVVMLECYLMQHGANYESSLNASVGTKRNESHHLQITIRHPGLVEGSVPSRQK